MPVILQSQTSNKATLSPASPLRVKTVTFSNKVQTWLIPARTAGGRRFRQRGVRAPNRAAKHNHGTRSNTKRTNRTFANCAVAYMSHTINPDTGHIAKYCELASSSERHLWQASNTKEIGRLAQGYKQAKGTNTMFSLPKMLCPKDKK